MKGFWTLLVAGLATFVAIDSMLAATPSPTPGPVGIMEGKLTMPPQRGVDLADDAPAPAGSLPADDHALVIRSQTGAMKSKEIKPDAKGHYRVALPPGDYVLEVKGSPKGARSRLAALPQRKFTVTANETVQVDIHVGADLQQMR